MSIGHGQANVQPKDIAEELLSTIKWVNETKGYCRCPGEHLHTNNTGDRACIVYLDGAATIYCQHQSCVDEVHEATLQLRKAIHEGAQVDPLRKPSAAELKQKQRENQRRHRLEIRGRASQSKILKGYRWTYEQIKADTKEKPNKDPSAHWRDIVGLFKPEDVIWIGDKWDSGGSEHQGNFKTAEEWLKGTGVPGQLTCPAAFKSNSISRNNDNVLHRRFLVVESDVHSKDDVGAIFKWLRDEVGLNLRAVVDTAGKSLHGWFDFPKQALLDQLQIILPQLGCDAGLFRASQPCRIPGALRDGKYQTLVYLDKAPKTRSAKQPRQVLPLPELYYDGGGQCYWRENNHGGWQKINEKSLDTEMVAQGFSTENDTVMPLSELLEAKRQIQLRHDIVYAGRVAGYHSGLHNILNQRILVTESPKIISPCAGEWPTLKRLFEGLLRDQVMYFYGWMKWGYAALRSGNFTSGQALAIAGPVNCGKSLLQNLITEILGGRTAKPYHYMTGKSNFNSELFGAEHLMIEDECASTKFEARRNIGAIIKTLTVNVTQGCYTKQKTTFTLTPLWRVSMSMNEEPEDLMVLPPFDDGIGEKLMLLKGHQNEVVHGIDTEAKRALLWKTLNDELPAFLAFLEKWEIPNELKADRLGIRTYHHPELVSKMRELQPEQRLMSLIDDCVFRFHNKYCFEGPAISLERMLTDDGYSLHREAAQLLRGLNSCGRYLGLLTKYPHSRVSQRVLEGQTLWKITHPDGREEPPI